MTPQRDWKLLDAIEALRTAGELSGDLATRLRWAARKFNKFRGADQRICDVTLPYLMAFDAWLIGCGLQDTTAEDAREYIAALVRKVDAESLPGSPRRRAFADAGDSTSLDYFLKTEYFPANSRIASGKTEKQYGHAVARLSKYLGRAATLADLTDRTIGGFMRTLRAEGMAAQTINGYRNKIVAAWTWAAKRRIVDEFPTIQNLPEPANIPRAWTAEQMQALHAAAAKMPGMVAGVPALRWWPALVLVCFDSGERTSALLAMRWEHYDAATGDLEVPAAVRKGGRKPMLYRLRPATMAAVDEIRRPERALIFPWPQNPGTFYNHWKRLLRLAGLPREKRKSGPQKIRRTFASYIEAAGGNASDALSHTMRRVTTGSYLDPRIVRRPPANLVLPEIA